LTIFSIASARAKSRRSNWATSLNGSTANPKSRQYESFLDEVGEQNYLAANVLASSLQALVVRGMTALDFEWRIAESAIPGHAKPRRSI
jgi:hypothetical protein